MDGTGWGWDRSCVRGPITVIAEGLTESECRHLSGLSAADAIAWCEARDKAAKAAPLAAAVADIEATAEVSESAAWAKVKAAIDALPATRVTRDLEAARAGWAEQTADAARLRIALQEAQQRLVQAHEDIDTLIAKQTATDRELLKAQQDNAHRGRLLARLLDEMARGYFVDRFLDPNLYADAMKAAGREVKP